MWGFAPNAAAPTPRHFRRDGELARLLTSSFAGTALRPLLPLALDMMIERLGDLAEA